MNNELLDLTRVVLALNMPFEFHWNPSHGRALFYVTCTDAKSIKAVMELADKRELDATLVSNGIELSMTVVGDPDF